MKTLFSLILVFACSFFMKAIAQNHFIFIQSDLKQPFIVKANGKEYESSPIGYIIIPRLKNGEYDLAVKFSKGSNAETRFKTVIDKKDVGYLLKDFGKNVAALTDMQTFASLAAIPPDSYAKTETVGEKNKGTVTKPPVETKSLPKENPSTTAIVKLKKGINKISQVEGEKTIVLTFVDVQNNYSDTIDVVIPVSSTVEKKSAYHKNSSESIFHWASAISTTSFENFQEGYNINCVHLYTKEELNRLRKKMSAENTDDKMVQDAVEHSKSKCFTTHQVKSLSTLFVKDSGKFKFFEAVYPFVYDVVGYPELAKEILDNMYRDKFLALLK